MLISALGRGTFARKAGLSALRAASSKGSKGIFDGAETSSPVEGGSVSGFSGFIPMEALKVAYSRSSGPGGQHVNKTESRAEVRFAAAEAEWIQPPELREAFVARYAHRLNSKGELIVRSERTRSQPLNLADCLDKLRFSIREVAEDLASAAKEPSEQDVAKWRRLEAKAARDRLRSKQANSMKKQARNSV